MNSYLLYHPESPRSHVFKIPHTAHLLCRVLWLWTEIWRWKRGAWNGKRKTLFTILGHPESADKWPVTYWADLTGDDTRERPTLGTISGPSWRCSSQGKMSYLLGLWSAPKKCCHSHVTLAKIWMCEHAPEIFSDFPTYPSTTFILFYLFNFGCPSPSLMHVGFL